MLIQHAGTELSLTIENQSGGFGIIVKIDGSKGEKIIKIEGKSRVDVSCPSIEGTVIWCLLKSGEERFFDSITGNLLSKQEVAERGARFYS